MAPAREPVTVSRPLGPVCDEQLLERVTPWSGRVLKRSVTPRDSGQPRIVKHDWVMCGDRSAEECWTVAEQIAETRTRDTGLTSELVRGRSDRGTMWLLGIGEREEAHFFATHREFLTFYRDLTGKGVNVDVLRDEAVTESRPGRMEIIYRKPGTSSSAATATWEMEIDGGQQAWVELNFALSDLSKQRIELENQSFQLLVALGHELTGNESRVPQLAPLIRGNAQKDHARRVSISVRCRAE